jgi:cytochrome c peroxidase
MTHFFLTFFLILLHIGISEAADWSHQANLPGNQQCYEHKEKMICFSDGNRKNIYELPNQKWQHHIYQGSKHTLNYPVTITELLIPYQPMQTFFESENEGPLRKFVYQIGQDLSKFRNFQDMFAWVGLHTYPQEKEYTPNLIANMGELQQWQMGASLIHSPLGKGITVSCTACHSSDLFGVKVVGLTNRFPQANEFFIKGQKALKLTNSYLYQGLFHATAEERKMFLQSKKAMRFVETKKPLALGLDTSLSQVALSLAKRAPDEYASRYLKHALNPRKNDLNKIPADSKPAVWWNTKYKTKWLSDGSIISGNPIHTNFLWNEIGRGIDLKNLEKWLTENPHIIQELTAYVFNTESPRFEYFFPHKIDIRRAKQGQKLYLKNCSHCHGVYEKGWDSKTTLNYNEQIQTTKVWYHTQTPTIDVGTDPLRFQGMQYFAKDLNRLNISKSIGTVVVPQKGYVPPPLVGIWARWPYFHNNSVPTLCDVLTPENKRPKNYWARAAQDKEKDFDQECNGYPRKELSNTKENKKYFFDTTVTGLSNQGHTKMLLDEDGGEKFSKQEIKDLVMFLQTL